MGATNIDYLDVNPSPTQQYLGLLNALNLHKLLEGSTGISLRTQTLIDYITACNLNMIKYVSAASNHNIFNHSVISC